MFVINRSNLILRRSCQRGKGRSSESARVGSGIELWSSLVTGEHCLELSNSRINLIEMRLSVDWLWLTNASFSVSGSFLSSKFKFIIAKIALQTLSPIVGWQGSIYGQARRWPKWGRDLGHWKRNRCCGSGENLRSILLNWIGVCKLKRCCSTNSSLMFHGFFSQSWCFLFHLEQTPSVDVDWTSLVRTSRRKAWTAGPGVHQWIPWARLAQEVVDNKSNNGNVEETLKVISLYFIHHFRIQL